MFKVGNQTVHGSLSYDKDNVMIKFPYNKTLLRYVKSAEGRRFDPETKSWIAKVSYRTGWVLAMMKGQNVYATYDQPLKEHPLPEEYANVKIWKHQIELYNHALTRKRSIIAGEAGSGKSLVALMVASYLNQETWLVSTKNALLSFKLEIAKWGCKTPIKMFTYDGLLKHLEAYSGAAPKVLILDEASKIKNVSTLRSRGVKALTDAMRDEHGTDCYMLLMTATPSPRAPTDWWPLAETACPGFLYEHNVKTFERTFYIIQEQLSISGDKYPVKLGIRDNADKCDVCGVLNTEHGVEHPFVPSVNEVARLAKRLDGLVTVKLKKECLDLPEHIIRIVRLKPTVEMLRMAKQIKSEPDKAVVKLLKLRQLSDGIDFPTPKWEFVNWFIDTYDARCVIWAAFKASVDKLVSHLTSNGWAVIQIDGRGIALHGLEVDEATALRAMDISSFDYLENLERIPKLAVIANPGSGGMSYTFTAAPAALYYGNDFNGENKMQSMERIHRGGMDPNRAATTYELIVLPEDMLVLDNLSTKKNLQAITMKDIEEYVFDPERCEKFEGDFL